MFLHQDINRRLIERLERISMEDREPIIEEEC